MNKQEKINIEIEKTLEAFDKIEDLPSNPFLYTRIKTKLLEGEEAGLIKSLLTVFKPALFLLLFLINIYTIVSVVDNKSSSNSVDPLNSFVKEYSLGQDNYYNNINF